MIIAILASPCFSGKGRQTLQQHHYYYENPQNRELLLKLQSPWLQNLRSHEKQRPGRAVNLEAVREEGDGRRLNVHLTKSHLVLELVDTVVGGIGVQQDIREL